MSTTSPNRWITSPAVRGYIYKVVMAAGPVLALYGVITSDEFLIWSGLIATVLGTPTGALANANTPVPEPVEVPTHQPAEVEYDPEHLSSADARSYRENFEKLRAVNQSDKTES